TSGSTETLQIAIIGRSNVTASFTDTDTTYSNGTGLALSSTTFSLAAGVITAGKYGNTTAVPVCTFDTYGRATTCTNTSISFPASSGGDGTGGWTNTTTVVSLVDSNDLVGIGTSSPDAKLDIERTSTQLRLGYSSTVNANFTVDSSGNLTIRSSSKNVVIQLG
ncbi:hypothetical protein JXB28_04155, partial [Candidatus Woesearchaeota archaeon]|nr:hypothetical protein [Candidatus Woesearchaeota archaeon]